MEKEQLILGGRDEFEISYIRKELVETRGHNSRRFHIRYAGQVDLLIHEAREAEYLGDWEVQTNNENNKGG